MCDREREEEGEGEGDTETEGVCEREAGEGVGVTVGVRVAVGEGVDVSDAGLGVRDAVTDREGDLLGVAVLLGVLVGVGVLEDDTACLRTGTPSWGWPHSALASPLANTTSARPSASQHPFITITTSLMPVCTAPRGRGPLKERGSPSFNDTDRDTQGGCVKCSTWRP